MWNSPQARAIIPDYFTFDGGASGSIGDSLGQKVTLTLMIRGKDPGLYINDTRSIGIITGGGLDATIAVGVGWFTADPRNVSSDVFGGP